MLIQSHCHHHHLLFFSNLSIPFPIPLSRHKPSLSFPSLHKPSTIISALPPEASSLPWLTHLAAELTTAAPPLEEGPIELPFSSTPSIFATYDDPSPIQVASSLLLTGAISVFLFRALRRRAKRVTESQFRSSGEKKSLKEEALDNLKTMGSASVDAKGPPSPVQAFLGGVSAGIIALILYKFATTVEASLSRQTLSDNFSVRQITVTIRTIVNGLCYLATFVFGINSVGLVLYSGKLAIDSFMDGSTEQKTERKSTDQSNLSNSSVESSGNNTELSSSKGEQSSNDAQ